MTDPHRNLPATAGPAQAMPTSLHNSLARPRSASEARAMLAARLTESEALKLVAIMLKHRDGLDPPAGPSYVKSLAARLMIEPREVAIACCDPVRGLVAEIFVRPVIADIARWCARESEPLRDWLARQDERLAFDAKCGPAVIDRSGRPTIEELRARLGPTFGIRRIDAIDIMRGKRGEEDEEAARQRRAAESAAAFERSCAAINHDYAQLGIEPVTVTGIPISAELAKQLGRLPKKAQLAKPDAKRRKRKAA